MRAVELVRRARQPVATVGAHVQAQVGSGVHRVHVEASADGPGPRRDPRHVDDGPDRVGRGADGDEAGAVRQEPVEGVVVECPGPPHGNGVHAEPALRGGPTPRIHVGAVVEAGDQQPVARREAAGECRGETEGQRGHVRAEGDLPGRRSEEVAGGVPEVLDEAVRLAARGEVPSRVGVPLQQNLAHRVGDAGRDLRPSRTVEVGDREAGYGSREGGHVRADGLDRPQPVARGDPTRGHAGVSRAGRSARRRGWRAPPRRTSRGSRGRPDGRAPRAPRRRRAPGRDAGRRGRSRRPGRGHPRPRPP